jgi:hypothetical protein
MGNLPVVEEIDFIFALQVDGEQGAMCGMGSDRFAHTARTSF